MSSLLVLESPEARSLDGQWFPDPSTPNRLLTLGHSERRGQAIPEEKTDAKRESARALGLSALEQIRATNPEVGIIMVTGIGDDAIARKTLAQGTFDYIAKPINLDYLKRSLEIFLLVWSAVPTNTRGQGPRARDTLAVDVGARSACGRAQPARKDGDHVERNSLAAPAPPAERTLAPLRNDQPRCRGRLRAADQR